VASIESKIPIILILFSFSLNNRIPAIAEKTTIKILAMG
jgi:hypothetical protein